MVFSRAAARALESSQSLNSGSSSAMIWSIILLKVALICSRPWSVKPRLGSALFLPDSPWRIK